MNALTRTLAATAFALALLPHAGAAEPAATAYKPSSAQLRGLCDTCAIVTAEKTDKRKGKATAVGTVGGAVAGGVVGKQVGDSTAATVGGAVVGGLIGREVEKRVKRHTVWITTVTLKDGSTRNFEATTDPALKPGDVVTIDGNAIRKR